MYEVELKVRAPHDPVRERLDGREAECVGQVTQVDTYYDAPHRDFARTDEAIRLRRESTPDGDRARLTYKGPLVDAESKTRRELETGVGDAETVAALLAALAFAPVATVRKERERFTLDGYVVALDAVDGLGEFVEVEREVEEGAVADAREGATALLRDLGLDPDDGVRTSYLGLLLAGDARK
jgi:adenylate cyclase class 2